MVLRGLWMVMLGMWCLITGSLQAQVLRGQVKDSHNEEPMQLVSVEALPARIGAVTDSLGFFVLNTTGYQVDSLVLTYVGYAKKVILRKDFQENSILQIALERSISETVYVRKKIDRGLILWRKVVRRKPYNDRSRFTNFGYELHNKLEVDLNRVNKERLKDIGLLKPFAFVLDQYTDTSEGIAVLPIFLTETISNYVYQRDPKRTREVISASKTNGVNNESVTRLLGGMYQNVNIYKNFIPVLDKEFVSPLSDNGDAYYNYATPDTVIVNGRRYYHWVFTPRRPGENTFTGDAWVHDTTFAIQRIQLRLNQSSNINFVENISIYQDFQMLNDSTWFLNKDKFIGDLYPIGKNKFGMKGRKTTTYRQVQINSDAVSAEVAKNNIAEEIVVLPDAEQKADSFWVSSRHEGLTNTEASIYKMIDTVQRLPAFQKYYNTLYFVTTGYKPIGKVEIGPWFNWVSLNAWEGLRFRFDLGTTPKLNKNMYLHGYLAYGMLDQQWKGKLEGYYFLKRQPRSYVHASFLNDIDNGQNYYDQVSLDNIFTLAIRKQNVPIKFMQVQMHELEYFTSNAAGLSLKLEARRKLWTPLDNIPFKSQYGGEKGDAFNTFETTVQLRFSYLEQFLEGSFFRFSLGSLYPTTELRYTRGWSGVMGSEYDYHKLGFRVNGFKKIPPFGTLDYSVYAGKVFGTVPYMMLDVAPGNEIYYYNKYAFNLMNRFEYITDRYAGFGFEHNIGSGIFKYLGITRRMKIRQFYNIRTLWGGLSEANRALNFVPGHPFTDLNGKMYTEVGTGIDNILRFLRFDLIWRVSPQPLPENWVQRFGVFGSFRLAL